VSRIASADHAAAPAPPSIASAVARFVLGSVLAIAVVVVGGYFALRQVTIHEAERDTRERVVVEGRLVESAGLTDGVLRRDPAALEKLDAVVLGKVLAGSIVRVKVWAPDGTILYSDEPSLIGKRYALGADELEILRTGGAKAELSDLSKPENKLERPAGKLLEAYTPIRTPDGSQVLFETYQRFSSLSSSATRLLRAVAPPLLGGLLVLLLVQVPLAWSMARRLQRGHQDREALLASAVEASAQERRYIASDLHDGVVQDLAGVAFGLAPLVEQAQRRGDEDEVGVLRGAIERLRQGVRDLRTLLVEIHPPNLESAGLEVVLSDLLSPLAGGGLNTSLRVEPAVAGGGGPHDALVYRTAREALRNVREHAAATSVVVAVTQTPAGDTHLSVADDGRGFAAPERERREAEGHLGLRLLGDLASRAGGRLTVDSEPGRGTTIELEVPGS
jgi:signal transduction histidine kinase